MTSKTPMKAKKTDTDKEQPVIQLKNVSLHYGETQALNNITLDIPQGKMVGLIGPDGVGKSSLMSLVTGARCIQAGTVNVLGGDMADKEHRLQTCPDIAYMPQGLGKNLYPTLSVDENAQFFARLFGQEKAEREARIVSLLQRTGLNGFEDRPAGKLSGGMKQKLGLICSLIHDPRLLVLDEPTTGVDPLSRRQFWDLIDSIRADGLNMSVLVATAYMEEAARFDWLIAMNAGEVLATGTPQEILEKTNSKTLNDAFIALMPEKERAKHHKVVIPPREVKTGDNDIAIEADGLTRKFGNFTAVDHVSFRIGKGEIFGFLGSNGCGKTTTMKMLTGLLPTTEGTAKLFGKEVETGDIESRRNVGYMSQAFSLYSELTVLENLSLHAKLFEIPLDKRAERIQAMMDRFDLNGVKDAMPDDLPLGIRQRMSLAVALIHDPKMLILDEPTSGVDPIARDSLWETLGELSRKEDVTIFISTHFMDEAARCDRISLMNAGQVIISDKPENIIKNKHAKTLEDAFIAYLQEAIDAKNAKAAKQNDTKEASQDSKQNLKLENSSSNRKTGNENKVDASQQLKTESKNLEQYTQNKSKKLENKFFSFQRMLTYAWREALELKRDPIRATMALLGSVILMLVIGYGINLDVQNLRFAVLDYDQTGVSRNYIQEISGSRYFTQQPDIIDTQDMENRLRSGDVSLVIEIPPDFAANMKRGRNVEVGAFLDGAMPMRAEIIRGYVQSTHGLWIQKHAKELYGHDEINNYTIEVRFRYNPDIDSLTAMAPGVIPILLLIIPAMLAALSVVREKEMGSIINLYVTPTTRLEFILGKQLPYVILGMINFFFLWLVAILIFKVDFTGSFLTFFVASLLYVCFSTSYGLFISTFMKTQIAAIFAVAIFSSIPAAQFCGLIDPVSSLEGFGKLVGEVFPTTYYITIARGTFSKALDFTHLINSFIPLVIVPLIIVAIATAFTRKQER